MSISSIKITNLLSFDNVQIDNFKDINCIVGMNNAGKSNFLKLVLFFYDKLNNKRVLSPTLNSNYTPYGKISITYNMKEIRNIVTKKKNIGKSDILSAIFNTFFSDSLFENSVRYSNKSNLISSTNELEEYTLTLTIHKNESIEWSTKNRKILKFINYLYPFFYINTRDIDLHNWDYVWEMVSKIKTYKIKGITQKSFTKFIDDEITESTGNKHTRFSEDIKKITNIIKKYNLDLSSFSYNEKLINFIKSGLEGHDFSFNGEDVNMQSDGTNSSNYIQVFISLLITLSRREYIIPALYIDEPEIGLHPKKSEELIYNIYDLYTDLNSRGGVKQYPHILFSTHSPNILKVIIKLFESNQQVLHFSKKINTKTSNKDINNTNISKLKSTYEDTRFLNRFTDNEARLFFSKFILFVEGETELELFANKKLLNYFPKLKAIDIYQTSDLTKIKNINPSYAKSNIPYYILYDLDKMIKIENKKIILKNANYDFKKSRIKYSNYYPDKTPLKFNQNKIPMREIFLKYISNSDSDKIEYTSSDDILIESIKINEKHKMDKYILKEDYSSYIKNLHIYLKSENIFINKNTIENVLINEDNINIFIDWLLYELKNNTTLKSPYDFKGHETLSKHHANKKYNTLVNYGYSEYIKYKIKSKRQILYNRVKNKLLTKNKKIKYYKCSRVKYTFIKDSIRIFNDFFKYSLRDNDNNLNASILDYFNKVKTLHVDNTRKEIVELKNELDIKTFTYIFVLLFNGKSECFKQKSFFKENKNLKILETHFYNLGKYINSKTGKTSNWATNFLNFYISQKEEEYSNITNIEKRTIFIKTDFKSDFNELYDIIEAINLKLVV